MDTFKLAHTAVTDWQSGAEECLQQLAEIPASANLAFIYVTEHLSADLGKLLPYLKEQTGIEHWVGTVGAAICCTKTEYYDQPAMAMMLCDFPPDSFYILTEPEHTQAAKPDELQFAVIHGDPRHGQIGHLIEQLAKQMGNAYLVGGLTSSNRYYYQIADQLTEGQLSGVVFNGQTQVLTGLSQGCTPIGPPHVLTEAEGHYAISIDQRPALDVLKEDIGEILARDLNRIGGYIFAGFPIGGSDTGDYLVRNLMGVDPDQGVLAIGDYLQSDRPILFCRRDGKTAIEDLNRMLARLKDRLDRPPKGGLYFSCMGRGQHMFGEPSREMQLIAEQLGDIPLIGFYANGEIAGQELYGYTGVLTLFV